MPVSPAYDAFVREPTGVVERMSGHPVYRTDVAAPIEAGESWQLGMFLAHAFQLSGLLAKPGDVAGKTILVTGGLDRDLKVTPVTHVAEKLARAAAPDQGEGVFLYPRGSEAVADTDGWQSLPVASVRDALKICLGREAAERFLLQQPLSEASKRASWRDRLTWPIWAAAFISILFIAALTGFVLWPSSTGDGTQSSGENAVGLINLSIAPRDPVSGECGDLVAIPPDRNVFKGPVCFGRMSVAERGEHRMRMTIDGAFSSYVDQSRYRRELQRTTGGGGRLVLQIDFPYWVREPVWLIAETEVLGMDGNPVRFERRVLEVMPGGGAGY
ncbi:hypothetical protein [Nisaea sp.]|uniref:hypothetical protein n=1 Tax=Nisaea sp. TaxID=2024842 RepID=UPI002B2791BC|nr:hypothetical protein [Nisaea sp.]